MSQIPDRTGWSLQNERTSEATIAPLIEFMAIFMKHYLDNTAGKLGLEREIIRIDKKSSQISETAHPKSLGNSFTHEMLTTDFAESQLEIMVPQCDSIEQLYQKHQTLMAFVQRRLAAGNEYGWPYSMPPRLPEKDDAIRIAQYASTSSPHKARQKELYRLGLKNRYGARMQCISGIHMNLSINPEIYGRLCAAKPEYAANENSACNTREQIDQAYLGMIRNFMRCSHILPFLFGASPCFDQSFLYGHLAAVDMPKRKWYGTETQYFPYATSLRQTEFGYLPMSQRNLQISYNSLSEYIESMQRVLHTPQASYKAHDSQQLNQNILQIENEHYSFIRPKASHIKHPINNRSSSNSNSNSNVENLANRHKADPPPVNRNIELLQENGIGYVEIRSLDISPYLFGGISKEYLGLLHLIFYYCLIQKSPPLSVEEACLLLEDHLTIAWYGRQNPESLRFKHPLWQQKGYLDSLRELFDRLQIIADILDRYYEIELYKTLLIQLRETHLVNKKETGLPSEFIMHTLHDYQSFNEMGVQRAREEQDFFCSAYSDLCPDLWNQLEQSTPAPLHTLPRRGKHGND